MLVGGKLYEVRGVVEGFERKEDSESVHEVVCFLKICLKKNGFESGVNSIEEGVSNIDNTFVNPTIL